MTQRSGLIYAVSAYLLWGVLPLYFLAISAADPFEIVPWRVIFSLGFCAILLTITRTWTQVFMVFRSPRTLGLMAIAGILVYINWQVYVYAALSGHVVEASFGYFINPIVTVLLAVVLLKETLTRLQWIAIGISFIAVIVLTVTYGKLPWISIALAVSFALYGLVKKKAGIKVGAVAGLTVETTLLTPIAIIQLIIVSNTVGLSILNLSATHTWLLIGAGAVTAVPLLFFAAGARRISLTQMGLTQFLGPILQFIIGVYVLHEDMPLSRWIGFGLVWLAVIVIIIDMVLTGRQQRAANITVAPS
ncbi:EamA family transporter RarD [Lysinibacter cavernae]|uniref:Chloramphenicol-sensitive protein RarD n=1 Tax=Lysinibacter cavernae TaxID=1640652 RepID=A0A7X5R1J5_9MICO|nr:chloramphenicol-sensitive protein RarD [Lysinibacter cavernae]